MNLFCIFIEIMEKPHILCLSFKHVTGWLFFAEGFFVSPLTITHDDFCDQPDYNHGLIAIKAPTREMPTRLKRNFIFTRQIYKNRGIARQPLDLDMSQSV